MHKNRGSAVIEITLMVPVILGCVYFYIMSMMYLVGHGKIVDELSERMYADLLANEVVEYEGDFENYIISVTLKADNTDPVKNLRRWQLVADTIR